MLPSEWTPRRCRRPAIRLSVESLEERTTPAAIPFRFTLDDPQRQFAAYPGLLGTFQAAGQILGNLLSGRGSLEVRIKPDLTLARAGGTTVTVTVVGQRGGHTIVENGPITEARTGVDPNGAEPDIDILINPRDYLPLLWFDPSGAARTGTVPANKIDGITLAMHELMHGLGIQGYRDIAGANYGGYTLPYETTYDAWTAFGTGGDPSVLYFNGPRTVAAYGRPLPLTSVGPSHTLTALNFYQLGNPVGRPGADLIPDLMNGVVFQYGTRYSPSAVDAAILADIGWGGQQPALPSGSAPSAPAAPRELTPLVQVVATGGRARRGRLVLQLWNTTGEAIVGPLTLLLNNVPSRVRFAAVSARGVRQRTISGPRLSVPLDMVQPGERVFITVEFFNGTGRRVRFVPRLFADS